MARLPIIGVLSDTHGYYDEILDVAFRGATAIVHAGDVGGSGILARLRRVAPVTAVAGNTDLSLPGDELPREAELRIEGHRVLVGHILKDVMARHDPVAEGYSLVITGHSHRAATAWQGGTLFLNPGSAGRARFGHTRTCALVELAGARLEPRIVPLGSGGSTEARSAGGRR